MSIYELDGFDKQWERIVKKTFDSGYNSLTPDERIWFNVQCLIGEVDNGGIIAFYYNSEADYWEETIEDLYKINADEIVEIIKQVNEWFPNSNPPKDIEERNEIICSWDYDKGNDKQLDELDELFYSLQNKLEAKLEPIVQRVLSK